MQTFEFYEKHLFSYHYHLIHPEPILSNKRNRSFCRGSNFIGDVGSTQYLAPNNTAFGVVYKWNKHTRYAFRASLLYATLEGNDYKSDINARLKRDFSFTNNIFEASAGIEFNFVPYDLHKMNKQFTPYMYSGLSYFTYENLYFDYQSNVALQYSGSRKNSIAIPMVLGVKGSIARNWILGIEAGARYTFTNNLDGSFPEPTQYKFGNLNSDDWYVFTGITLTFTFGEKPCFCAD